MSAIGTPAARGQLIAAFVSWQIPSSQVRKTEAEQYLRRDDPPDKTTTADEATLVASILRAALAEYESLHTPQAFAATVLDEELARSRIDEGRCGSRVTEA